MILVTGAGGKTGKALIQAFSKVEHVCAFVHHREQASVAMSLGAERVVAGDLLDEAAIRDAMQGVRAVYHVCPNMSPDEVVMGKLVMGAAREMGVERFVYHSVLHPQTGQMPHHWAKLRVEEMLFESGLAFTVLQPAPYMQNFLAGWKSIVEDGVLQVPYSIHSQFSFIDLDDLAEVACRVITGPDHANAIYELAGTQAMTCVAVAEILSRTLERPVYARQEQIGDWRSRGVGMSGYGLDGVVRMFAYYDQFGLAGNPNVLSWILRREPASLESFFRRTFMERDAIH